MPPRTLLVACFLVLSVVPAASSAQSRVAGRRWPAVVALEDGALVAGGAGANNDVPLASAEILGPQGWSRAAPMTTPRARFTLTRLRDRRVLAAGGQSARDPLASAEVWSPATQSWSVIESMHVARAEHVAIRLADGRVLVAGGAATTSTEIWDPATGHWTVAGDLNLRRQDGSAALVGDGRVVVSGTSFEQQRQDDVEVFDPRARTWSFIVPPMGAIERVIGLPDGTALVLGHRRTATHTADTRGPVAMTWDPATHLWRDAGSVATTMWPRGANIVVRPDGRVMVAGGQRWQFPSAAVRVQVQAEACEGYDVPFVPVRDVTEWDPATRLWSRHARLVAARVLSAAALLPDGTVLVTGGAATNRVDERLRF